VEPEIKAKEDSLTPPPRPERVLTLEQIKEWVDVYVARNDKFPSQHIGTIKNADGSDTQETWKGINALFRSASKGSPARGLQNSGYSSLADFIDKTYQRERKEKYDLTIEQIKNWVDAYREIHEKFPSHLSGTIKNADGSDTQESWAAIDQLFRKGSKGYPARGLQNSGYSSLADFIDKNYAREKKNDLTPTEIKNWADTYLETNEKFPSVSSGAIKNADGSDTQETWVGINALFVRASKGSPARGLQNCGYSSLADFVDKTYQRRRKEKFDLTIEQIKNWVDAYLETNEKFPSKLSGAIKNADGSDTRESWAAIEKLFREGSKGRPARGLQNSGYSSLADFIDKTYQRERKEKYDLTIEQIKNWVDAYLETNEKFPSVSSGAIKNADGSDTQETWKGIDALFRIASKGYPARGLQHSGSSSLTDFIDKNYGREKKNDLTLTEIKNWVDAYLETNKKFPSAYSGAIKNADGSDTQETWKGIDALFRIASKGYPARGLQNCDFSYLRDFLDKTYPDRRQAGSQQAPGPAADDLTTLLDLMEM
jgi:flavodoxin